MDESTAIAPAISEREKELSDKLGARTLLVWLVVLVAFVEMLVIVQLAK
ncbi:hypothetical protein [Hyphomicrobium methylovorum]|nr:hypothetical protein [Hyphomicrobium methylovorum]